MKFALGYRFRLMAVFVAVSLSALAEVKVATPAGIGSAVFAWEGLAKKNTPVGISRAVVDGPTPTLERFEMHVTTLNPGQMSHPPHHHPQEELILVKDGTFEVSINGRTQTVGAGSMFFFAAHDVHNARNVGTTPGTYYVINFYSQATGTVRNQPAAEWEPAEMLHSTVVDWNKLETKTTANDVRRYLIDSPSLTFSHLEIHATTVQPGRPPSVAHRHPWVQLVIIKEGTMEATVEGRTLRAGPGAILFIASNNMQSMKNVGDVPSTYFVFSVSSAATPKPTE